MTSFSPGITAVRNASRRSQQPRRRSFPGYQSQIQIFPLCLPTCTVFIFIDLSFRCCSKHVRAYTGQVVTRICRGLKHLEGLDRRRQARSPPAQRESRISLRQWHKRRPAARPPTTSFGRLRPDRTSWRHAEACPKTPGRARDGVCANMRFRSARKDRTRPSVGSSSRSSLE